MRPSGTAFRLGLCIHLLLLSAFLLQPPLAVGQEPQLPSQSQLTPDVCSRLTEAARDAKLEPWQREFMLGVARGSVEGGAAATAPALSGRPLAPAGIASIDGDWTRLNPPSRREDPSAIYDPVRDRMVVFGGDGASGGYFNDVWALSLAGSPAWSEITPAGPSPSARTYHTAIYDPARDRMVVFGGTDGAYRNDVWALSLAGSPAWTALTPAGTPPSARYWHTAIYDPVRDQMVMFGGADMGGSLNDVWALSLAGSPVWIRVFPAGTPPSARYGHTANYDPVRDRMVVLGGYDGSSHDDVWALTLAGSPAWSRVFPAGAPPSARYLHTAIYDPVRDRMVMFGGAGIGSSFNDAWALSLAGIPVWSDLSPAGTPPSAYLHTAIYDPVRDRMVSFSGSVVGSVVGSFRNDLWALSLAVSPAWSELSPLSSPPDGRHLPAAIYDPVRDRMVVFGGYDDTNFRNDVWALSLVGIPAWSPLAPTGTPPSARFGPSAIYDPLRDRMVVYGGYGGSFEGDVWALSLAGSPAWTALGTVGTPPQRYGHTAIYDPLRDRMVVYAGYDGTNYNSDVWELSLAGSLTWSPLATTGGPPSRRVHQSSIYDPVRDRMVMYGGADVGGSFDDVWALSLAGSPVWSALAPAGTPPSARQGHPAIYDPARDRMVVFGGSGGPPTNDVWALSLAGSTAWSELAPAGTTPMARVYHVAIYDPVRDRMVAFGGSIGGSSLNDAWALAWTSPVSVPWDGIAHRFEFALPRPNPSRGETTLDFELAEPARVVMDVFDAQGRRVNRIADAWFTGGRHASSWRGDDQNGNPLGAGMYFIRMQVDDVQTTRRTVQIR